MYYKKPVFVIERRTCFGTWEVVKKKIDVGFGESVESPMLFPDYQSALWARDQMNLPATKLRIVKQKYFKGDGEEDEEDED